MRIQHNIAAMNSHRNLGVNSSGTNKNLEKLSSGYRINRAGDDAAGLAVSEKMRGQIRGLAMAEQNTSNGINLIQTAEGGLNETQNILQRMRELAVQSSNGTYQDEDREQLTREFTALKSEVDRIAESTHYNNIKLLDGSLDMKGVTGSANTAGADGGAAGKIVADNVKAATGLSATATAGIAPDKASGTSTKLAADATITFALDDAGELVVKNNGDNGTVADVKFEKGILSFAAAGDNTADKELVRVNVGGMDEQKIKDLLQGVKGESVDIKIGTDGTVSGVEAESKQLTKHSGLDAVGISIAKGSDANAATFGKQDVKIEDKGDGQYEVTIGNTSKRATMADLEAGVKFNGLDVTVTDKAKFKDFADKYGAVGMNDVHMMRVNGGSANSSDDLALDFSRAEATLGNKLTFQIGANGGQDQRVNLSVGNMDTKSLGKSRAETWESGEILDRDQRLADASIGTIEDANKAIEIITKADAQVSATRADLGALQNRLESTMNNLGTTKENLTASESTIRDVDMAKEMMDFTKNNILVQSSQSMLAQANQLPQGVLSLLR